MLDARVVETGRLNHNPRGYTLCRDGGGTWRLELALRSWWRARRLVGNMTELTAIRDGFDLLSVTAIPPL